MLEQYGLASIKAHRSVISVHILINMQSVFIISSRKGPGHKCPGPHPPHPLAFGCSCVFSCAGDWKQIRDSLSAGISWGLFFKPSSTFMEQWKDRMSKLFRKKSPLKRKTPPSAPSVIIYLRLMNQAIFLWMCGVCTFFTFKFRYLHVLKGQAQDGKGNLRARDDTERGLAVTKDSIAYRKPFLTFRKS